MQKMRHYKNKRGQNGFTLVEIIIVVVILSIAAMIAVPMVSSAADIQVRSAANQIAAHLDYAKSMAITHQQAYSVVFDVSTESYQVQDEGGNLIDHPVNPGDFVVNLSNTELDKVDITSADFDGVVSNAVTFDYLGSPYSGTDTTAPLNSGQILLQATDFSITVSVEPVTGYVTMSSL
jgi:prepilin-type N-terminal cleavage/methylation domain-containing protein